MQNFNEDFILNLSFDEVRLLYKSLYNEGKRWEKIFHDTDDDILFNIYDNDGPLLTGLIDRFEIEKEEMVIGNILSFDPMAKELAIIIEALRNELNSKTSFDTKSLFDLLEKIKNQAREYYGDHFVKNIESSERGRM